MEAEEQKSLNLAECTKANLWAPYFKNAEPHLERQWEELIWPVIRDFDFSVTLELAPGGGRNSAKLIPLSREIHLVDVNQYCIETCKERFADYEGPCRIHYHVNDGTSLAAIAADSITTVYTWDSAVHMDKLVIRDYLVEFARVMRSGGQVFLHHSDYGRISDSIEFKKNPHWRSNMSAVLCVDYCAAAGLEVVSQQIIGWGGDTEDLDCISVIRKP